MSVYVSLNTVSVNQRQNPSLSMNRLNSSVSLLPQNGRHHASKRLVVFDARVLPVEKRETPMLPFQESMMLTTRSSGFTHL